MANSKWKAGTYVYLIKKKGNGHPRHRSIGEKLHVLEVDENPKYIKLKIEGNMLIKLTKWGYDTTGSDFFWLHESFVMNEVDYREDALKDLLD